MSKYETNNRLLRAKMLSIVSLCARNKEDKRVDNKDEKDFVETTLREWFPNQVLNIKRFYLPNGDFTLYIDFGRTVVFAHLGTQQGGWFSNIVGYFWKIWRGWMHGGFGKAAEYTFEAIEKLIVDASSECKTIIQTAHSRGCPRAIGVALRSYQKHKITIGSFLFNPPPSLTKKGVETFKEYGLNNFTEQIVPHDFDPVGIAGELRFNDAPAKLIKLPDVNTTMSSLPVGAHSYSVAFEGSVKDALINKDQETINWLTETRGVCTV